MTTTDLDLRGMSCASCAARVEGALNRLEGVRAAVNFALERAHVQHESEVSTGDLIRAVESTGYHASVAVDLFSRDDDEAQDCPHQQITPQAFVDVEAELIRSKAWTKSTLCLP